MNIYTIIPNWNGKRFLQNCLASLQHQTIAHEIVVVDNGSNDGSVALIETCFPGVHIVRLDKNRGFAGGVNAGIKYALDQGAEYIALFNNDAVAEADWLEHLVNTIQESEQAGIVTGKLLEQDRDVIDSTGDCYSIWGTPFPRGRGEVDHGQYDSHDQRRVLAASGGASLYRASVFEQIGRFDERFFAYYEDVDISFRARLAGWEVLYEPAAVARHAIGGTSQNLGDFRLYHMYKNFWFLFVKNMPGVLFWKYGWRVAGVFGFKLLQLLVRLKLVVFLKVLGSVLWHTPGLLWARWRLQRSRRTSPAAIDRLLHHAPPPTQPGLVKIVQKLHLS